MKLGRSGTKTNNKSLTSFALYAFLAFIAFAIADLTIIYYRDRMLPDQAPPKKVVAFKQRGFVDRDWSPFRLRRDPHRQRQQLFALIGERRHRLSLGAADVDATFQSDRAPASNVQGGMARGDPTHALARVAVTVDASAALGPSRGMPKGLAV